MTKAQVHAYDDMLFKFDILTFEVKQSRKKVERVVDRLLSPINGKCKPDQPDKSKEKK